MWCLEFVPQLQTSELVGNHRLALEQCKLANRDKTTLAQASRINRVKWNDVDFQTNEISVTRAIVFQVVGPCKTEASQKPIPLDSRLAEALKVWRDRTKYRTPGGLGICQPSGTRAKTILGPVPHANDNPSSSNEGRDHTAHRVAHLPAHVFFIVESQQNGHQSDARIASSRVQSCHVGHVHPGSHSTEATSTEQRHSSSAGIHSSGWLRRSAGDVFLFCAYSNRHDQCENTGSSGGAFALTTTTCALFVPRLRRGKTVSC